MTKSTDLDAKVKVYWPILLSSVLSNNQRWLLNINLVII